MKNSSREKYSPWVNKRRMSRDIYEVDENGECEGLLWLFLSLFEWNKNISNQLSLYHSLPRRPAYWRLDREPIDSLIPRLSRIRLPRPPLPFHQEYPNFLSSNGSSDFITGIRLVYSPLIHLKSSLLSVNSQNWILPAISFEFEACSRSFHPPLHL